MQIRQWLALRRLASGTHRQRNAVLAAYCPTGRRNAFEKACTAYTQMSWGVCDGGRWRAAVESSCALHRSLADGQVNLNLGRRQKSVMNQAVMHRAHEALGLLLGEGDGARYINAEVADP